MDSKFIPQTRESVESAKKCFEYESFEYESRLDPSLVKTVISLAVFIARRWGFHEQVHLPILMKLTTVFERFNGLTVD